MPALSCLTFLWVKYKTTAHEDKIMKHKQEFFPHYKTDLNTEFSGIEVKKGIKLKSFLTLGTHKDQNEKLKDCNHKW